MPGAPKLKIDLEAQKKRRARRRHRNADWGAIRALYLSGMKATVIADRFGIPAPIIRDRASKEKWFSGALASTPKLVVDKIMRQGSEATGKLLSEIWAERGEAIREKEFRIAEKAATHAETMEEGQLLNKIDKVKIAIDMGRRSTGLDKVESNPNAVNIAVLGEVGVFDGEAEIYKRKKPRE
jgi:uncharacterized protein YjcR